MYIGSCGCVGSQWLIQVSFNPKGSRLMTVSADATARLWDLQGEGSGRCCQVLVGHQDEIFSACWSYDGDVILTGICVRPVFNARFKPNPGQLTFSK